MLIEKSVRQFLDDLASNSPAPGGGSVAALSGALGAALTAMVCRLTIDKKKYADARPEMENVLQQAEQLQSLLTTLIDKDTEAFNKVMEAYGLPKESDAQKALRSEAIQSTTVEASLVPLEIMHHCLDGLALAKVAAHRGNVNSVSDAGVSARMLAVGLEGAALNVQINLGGIQDKEFVLWKTDEVKSLLKSGRLLADEIAGIVSSKITGG